MIAKERKRESEKERENGIVSERVVCRSNSLKFNESVFNSFPTSGRMKTEENKTKQLCYTAGIINIPYVRLLTTSSVDKHVLILINHGKSLVSELCMYSLLVRTLCLSVQFACLYSLLVCTVCLFVQ